MLLFEFENLVPGNVVYNDELNPKLYDQEGNMHPEVHEALMAVAKNFVEDIDLPNMVIHDIILTGSSANYNWTKYSDVDLHLISDIDVFADPHMAAKYFNAAKNVWNNNHDVDIRGLDVEVYVEDNDEFHESLGRFSVMNDKWITKPVYNKPVFDEDAVNRKVRYIMAEIDALMQEDDAVADIQHLKKKIWLMRGEGLTRKGGAGEYSVENLAFKILRNMGYLDKIREALDNAEDRELSVREIAEGDRRKPFELVTYQPNGDVYVTGYDDLKTAIAFGRDGLTAGELGFKVTNSISYGEEEVYHSEGKIDEMKINEIEDPKGRIVVHYNHQWADEPFTMKFYDHGQSDEEVIKQTYKAVGGRNHTVTRITESQSPTVEDVGAFYAKYKTDDWQNRDGAYPKSGVPDAVDNAGSYGDEAFIEFSFKNTPESHARTWVHKWLQSKRLPFTKITTGQDGDYNDDWVMVYVTYTG